MKKIYSLFILLVSFFIMTLKANAIVPLCVYSGEDYLSSDDAAAYIFIEGNQVTVHFDSTLGAIGDFQESLIQNALFAGVGGPVGFGYSALNNDFSNRLVSIMSGTKSYTLVENGNKAVENFSVNTTDAETIDVEWEDNVVKDAFFDYGYCPKAIFEDADNGVFDFASIKFLNSAESVNNIWSTVGSFIDQTAFQNRTYYLQYAMFQDNADLSVAEVESCPIMPTTLHKYVNLFDVLRFFSTTEQLYVRDLYVKNGYDQIADAIIANYAPNGSCQSSNSDIQALYDEMYQQALNFKAALTGEMQTGDIDCNGIIGDPSNTGSFAWYLNMSIKFIQYLGPILVIVFTIIEYFKALIAGDADALKKANKRTVTRLVFAALLFLIPALINTLLNIFHIYSDCSIVTNL